MSEEVLRFVNVRSPQAVPEARARAHFAVYGDGKRSPLHERILALAPAGARDAAVAMARELLRGAGELGEAYGRTVAAAESAAGRRTVGDALKEAERALGAKPADYLKTAPARTLRDAVWDRVYAHTLAPEERPEERDRASKGVRAFHMLELLLKQAATDRPLTDAEARGITPIIPADLVPPPTPPGDGDGDGPVVEEALAALDAVYQRVVSLDAAVAELRDVERVTRSEELRNMPQLGDSTERLRVSPLESVRVLRPALVAAPGVVNGADGERAALPIDREIEEHLVIVPKKTPWLFEGAGRDRLGAPTKAVLDGRKRELEELEVNEVVATLEHEKYEAVTGFLRTVAPAALPTLVHAEKLSGLMERVAIPGATLVPVKPEPEPAPGSAAARGIQPLGMGDLLVIRQHLERYADGEVAHIENVLASESKSRSHLRARDVEEIVVTEVENVEESEKDLQTTERFELQREAEKTVQSDMSLEAGLAVTASYGPVSVSAHADFALSESSEEATRTASTFAKQVTERSVSRIIRRTRELRTRRTLERFEEKNEHGFDNRGSKEHVVGVYRWVDKYYVSRLVNYGRRLMMEFIVPEPAAFYLRRLAQLPVAGVTLEKPEPPVVWGRPLQPTDLTRFNYSAFVSMYGAQDVAPYPAEVVRVSAAYAEGLAGDKNTDVGKTSEKLVVPKDYRCSYVFGQAGWQGYKGYFFECFVAGQRWGSVTAEAVEGPIPISVKGWVSAFHVNIVAVCELTDQARTSWQLKTYAAIMEAYERRLADYNEQVAAAQIQAGVDIQGRNPAFNRTIEQEELRKGALRLLTDEFARLRVGGAWRFNERFDAMRSTGEFGYPEFDTAEALVEGKILQFFEQAFEWQNMTYRFYPYFWGRKGGWKDVFGLTDTDPQFASFLRAGAARVVIPVHPAYAQAVLHYLASNEVWNGGEPPTLDDPLYISIVDELKSDSGAELDGDLPPAGPGSGYPCLVDQWQVKLPTTLVHLQPDGDLPDMRQPTARLLMSTAADRSDPVPLGGRTLSGDAFVFLSEVPGMTQARFYLDDPERARAPKQVEDSAPWDLLGAGTDGKPRPLKPSTLGAGQHTVTVAYDVPGAGEKVVHATVSVG